MISLRGDLHLQLLCLVNTQKLKVIKKNNKKDRAIADSAFVNNPIYTIH
jgi:hypothetical protein